MKEAIVAGVILKPLATSGKPEGKFLVIYAADGVSLKDVAAFAEDVLWDRVPISAPPAALLMKDR